MIGLNTSLGPTGESYFGVAVLIGKEELAHGYIDQEITYVIDAGAVSENEVAGVSNEKRSSESVSQDNLTHACIQAALSGITIFIDLLSPRSVQKYHIFTV